MTTEHIAKGLDQFLQDEFAASLKGKTKSFGKLRTNLQDAWNREKQSKISPLELAAGFLEQTEKVFSKYVNKAAKEADKDKRKQRKDGFQERARETLVQLAPGLVEKIDFVKIFDECLSAEFKASASLMSGPPHFEALKQEWDITKKKSEGNSELSLIQLGAAFFISTYAILVSEYKIPAEKASAFLNTVRDKLIQYDPALYFKIDVFYALESCERYLKTDGKGQVKLQAAVGKIKELCLNSTDDIPALYKNIQAIDDGNAEVKDLFVKLSSINKRYAEHTAPKVSVSEPALVVAAAPVVEDKKGEVKQPTPYVTTSASSPTKPTVVQTHPRVESASFSQRAAKALNVFAQSAKVLGEAAVELVKEEARIVAEEAQDLVGIKSATASRDSSRESTSASSQPSPASSPSRKKQAEPTASELEMTGSPTGITPQSSPKGESPTVAAQVVDPIVAEAAQKQEAERVAKDKLISELKAALEQEIKDESSSAKSKQSVIKDLDGKIKAAGEEYAKKRVEYDALTQTIVSEKESIRNGVASAIQNKTERLSKDFRFAFRKSNMKKLDDAFAALPSEQFQENCRATAANVVKGLLGGVLSGLPGFLGGNFFKRRLDARVDAAVDYLQDRKAQQDMNNGLTDQNAEAISNAAGRFANVNVGGLVQHLGEQTAKDAEVQSSHEAGQALIKEKREHESLLQKAHDALWLLLQFKSNWGDITEKLRADPDKYNEISHTWSTNNVWARWKKVAPQLYRLFAPEQELAASAQSSARLGQKG